jgi:membrane-associated phospholipid phosphatase
MAYLSKILFAAGAGLALSACADRATGPDAPAADVPGHAVGSPKFWQTGASVGWNGIARGLVATASPFVQVRVLTYLSLAQYNAIIAAENSKTPGTHPSRAAAAGGASVAVLTAFFPSAASSLEGSMDQQAAAPAWPGEQHLDFAAGEAIGRTVGAAVASYASTDHFLLGPLPSPQPVGPGRWINTAVPAAPAIIGLFGVRTLVLASADQFRSSPPPAFDLTVGSAFETALEEIQSLSTNRTPAQLAVVQFWNPRVAGYQNEIASDLIVSHRRSERDAAHILALANMAAFDAVIGCWDAKYTYWYIRPSQVSGQPVTITLPIGLPNHPSYPSGHSCTTAAYSTVLGSAFPEEQPGLEANVEAAGLSRMYGGIHYRFDIEAGQLLGHQVAAYVLAHDVGSHEAIPLD